MVTEIRSSFYKDRANLGGLKIFKLWDGTLVSGCFLVETNEPRHWVLSSLWVIPSQRGRKLGSLMVKEVCAWADEEQVILLLEAEAYGENQTMPTKILKAFYKRYGFSYDVTWGLLKREPKATDSLSSKV